jgi:uncharacterized membrane protein
MNDAMLLALRTVHILGGVFWVGGAFIVGLFILPAVRALGPAGMPVIQHIMLRRKLSVYLPVSAVVTVLAGGVLYWHDMKLSGGAWRTSPMGQGMTFGATAALLAVVAGMGIASPAAKKLASGGPTLSDGERARLGKRAAVGSLASMVLLLIATVAMSVARYL